MVWNVLAIAIAASALLASSFLAVQQAALMHRANHVPVYLEFFSEFRSLKFQDHCSFIVNHLSQEFVAEKVGISELSPEAREAVWDVGGLFTEMATLRLMGAVDRRVDSMVQVTLPAVWNALAPFVYEERRRRGVSKMFWRALEEFAMDVASLPEGSINAHIERHRRTGRPWVARRPSPFAAWRSAPVLPPTASPEAVPDIAGADDASPA
jgi:hypothetical protein